METNDQELGYNAAEANLKHMFQMRYAPYLIKDYVIPERHMEDIPISGQDEQKLRILAHQVDLRREKDPHIGAKLASNEILAYLKETLKTDKGIHAESLLAILGACGGFECMLGVMSCLEGFNAQELWGLGVMIAETGNGEKNLMGDLIGNEFLLFYMNAAGGVVEQSKAIEMLKPIAEYCAGKAGRPEYWKTPYHDLIGKDPLEIAQLLRGRFDPIFAVYARFPQERMMSFALATQKVVQQVAAVTGMEKALSILAEYGWRTSHYINL